MSDLITVGSDLLFDKIINVTLYGVIVKNEEMNTTEKYIVPIKCLDWGYKPAISMSINLLPGGICYRAVVKITNAAFAKEINIRNYNMMDIEVGYRQAKHVGTFSICIFTSYVSKPNPDGEVTFEGLTIGQSGVKLMSAWPHKVLIYKDKITCRELVTKFAQALGLRLDVSHCHKEILASEITFTPCAASSENGLAALQWLQGILYQWGQSLSLVIPQDKTSFDTTYISQNHIYLNLVWQNDTLMLISAWLDADQEYEEDVIELHAVKNASFAGPALTVQAMYVPEMAPGKIFEMPTYYFDGSKLPNVMGTNIYNPDNGLYRCITMSIDFDTTGNTNNMTLMGVPVSNYQKDPASDIDYTTAERYRNVLRASVGDTEKGPVTIKFGEKAPPKEEDIPPKKFEEIKYNPTDGTTQTVTIMKDGKPVKRYQNWESVGRQNYGDDLWKVKLDTESQAKVHQIKGIPKCYFFPIAISATYNKMLSDKKAGYFADKNNPDLLLADQSVFVPTLDPDIFVRNHDQDVADLFKTMAQFYYKINKPNYAPYFEDIALYIEKGQL